MSSIIEYMHQFEECLRCKTDSEATLKSYMGAVERFLHWCSGRRGNPAELLRQYLIGSLRACPKTSNLHRAAIVRFFYIVKSISITPNEVPRKREPKQLPQIISQNKIQEAIAKTYNIKHRLELIMFYGMGLRLGEVAQLQRKNIRLKEKLIQLVRTKGNRHRIVPIPPSIIDMLSEFIANMQPDAYIFAGQYPNTHISKKSLENVVSLAFERIGEHAHPHMLRHSFATHQIMAGESPFKLQRWMGHASIKTTQGYINLAEDQLSKSTDLLSDRNYTNVSEV